MTVKDLSVRTKIYLLMAACFLALIGSGLWSARTLSIAKVHGPYYKDIVQGKDLIADILPPPNYIIESYLMALHMANETEEGVTNTAMRAYTDRCEALKAEFDERHQYWIEDLPDGEMKTVKVVDTYNPANSFYQVMFDEFIPACLEGDSVKAKELSRGSLREHYEVHRTAVDKVVAMAIKRTADTENAVTEIVESQTTWATITTVLLVFGLGGLGWYIARETVSPLKGSANRLQQLSSEDLTNVSQRLRDNAERTSDQATSASSAAEQVSENAQSLTTAVEQFEQSIREIAGNASNAASVARQAVDAAGTTNSTITRLGESSAEIGNVIKVINSIAEQTNLLALNATIEAARAGEAGKGFAVVANEVKELAKETSKATEDIVRRIETIQGDTQGAVDAIGLVSDIISQINESQNAIAGAVEEQTAMTSEISRNISEVAEGSGEIARNISEVAETARSTTEGSDETLSTAAKFEDVALELLSLVGEVAHVSRPLPNRNTSSDRPSAGGGKYQLSAPVETTYNG